MPPPSPVTTINSVKDGCAHLANQLGSLRNEITNLSDKLKRFKRGRDIPNDDHRMYIVDHLRGERNETPEPKSPIWELDEELSQVELTKLTRVLFAIGKEIDAGVREVRAARATLQAIADDSDLRAEFKDW